MGRLNILRQYRWSRLVVSVLNALGALWICLQIADYFFSGQAWLSVASSYWWGFLALGLTIGFVRARNPMRTRIEGTDVLVEVRVGNVFSLKGAIVVGCNTTFDTAITDGTISENSIQGQFTKRYFRRISELDRRIYEALERDASSSRDANNKPFGKRLEYPMGTVAPVQSGDRKGYFVAIAKLNEHRVAETSEVRFLDALPVMWNQIRNRGRKEDLVCPVLGSGYSRLNLKRGVLVQEIIRSFAAATREGKIAEKLTLVIHGGDLHKSDIDLKEVRRFLECECRYNRTPKGTLGTGPTGSSIGVVDG